MSTEAATLSPITGESLRKLGKHMTTMFDRHATDRRGAEQQWAKNLRQFNGVYDPEFLTNFDPNQSRAYPRLTRVKVVSLVARLMSLLFPSGEKNWSLSPSAVPSLTEETLGAKLDEWMQQNPEAQFELGEFDKLVAEWCAASAKQMEKHIDDQLGDVGAYGPADYAGLVKQVVRSAVLFGVGVMKGPMTVQHERATVSIGPDGSPVVSSSSSYRPYFEWVPSWDYYPDMSAKNGVKSEGDFVRHVFSRHQLARLAEREDFKGDAIRKYLQDHPDGNYTRRSHETDLAADNEAVPTAPTGKYEAIEYWGYISGKTLKDAGVGDVSDDDAGADVVASLWTLDGVVIKASQSPYEKDFAMFHTFLFEDDEVSPVGVGLPEIMRDSQLSLAAATRMLIDNASVVCGPNAEIDIDALVEGQDYTFRPFKAWLRSGGEGRAVSPVQFDAHIDSLLAVIRTFRDFADSETFVGPATGGDMSQLPSEGMRTTGGASMIMGSAALPFRDVVRNFDYFTVSVIRSLVRWNEVFNADVEVVGDMRPVGRGATTLMAKELRAASIDNLAQTMLDEERDYINMEALAKQRLITRDLPLDELLVSEERAQENRKRREDSTAEAAEQQRKLFEAELRNMAADTVKQLGQARKHIDAADVSSFNAAVAALEKGVDVRAATEIANSAGRVSEPSQAEPGNPAGDQVPRLPDGGEPTAFDQLSG